MAGRARRSRPGWLAGLVVVNREAGGGGGGQVSDKPGFAGAAERHLAVGRAAAEHHGTAAVELPGFVADTGDGPAAAAARALADLAQPASGHRHRQGPAGAAV